MATNLKVGVLGFAGIVSAVAGLLMGLWWLLWQLWTFVVPAIYPAGNEQFIHPSYWLFAGMWTLLVLVVNVFRAKKGN